MYLPIRYDVSAFKVLDSCLVYLGISAWWWLLLMIIMIMIDD